MLTGKPTWSQLILAALVLTLLGRAALAMDKPESIVTRVMDGTYAEVAYNVRTAIIGKGINIAHVLPAQQMLHRTGPDFGYQQDVYLDAETFEFCSAKLSHKLARIHPDNILMCPFTISVYVVAAEPDKVRISYRVPHGRPGSDKVVGEIVGLIESILDDASW